MEGQSAPIPKEMSSKLGGSIDIVRRAQLGSIQPSFSTVVSDCSCAALLDELFEHSAQCVSVVWDIQNNEISR
jgi:hypothetical protein